MRVEFDSVFVPVDSSIPVPLYLQVVTQIDDAVRRGKLRRGSLFPSEFEMCDGFGIARSTLRRAFQVLEERGIITRERGRGGGTRISSTASISRRPGTFDTVFELIAATQRIPHTRLVLASEEVVDEAFAKQSGFPVGASIIHFLRQRSADDVPIAVLENWVLVDRVTFDTRRLKDESMDKLLRGGGVVITHVEFEFLPSRADDHAEFFRVDADTPIIIEVRRVYDREGQYEYSHLCSHPFNDRIRGSISP